MRRVRYHVAASLDGFIAGPNGEIDWIVRDDDVDFVDLFRQFDTFLVGRRTYQTMLEQGRGTIPGKRLIVFSRTLRQGDHRDVRVVAGDIADVVAELRAEAGLDIWVFGGGSLFRSLLQVGAVDTVEVAVMPVLIGAGIPLLGGLYSTTALNLTDHRLYPKSGIVSLKYEVGSDASSGRAGA